MTLSKTLYVFNKIKHFLLKENARKIHTKKAWYYVITKKHQENLRSITSRFLGQYVAVNSRPAATALYEGPYVKVI